MEDEVGILSHAKSKGYYSFESKIVGVRSLVKVRDKIHKLEEENEVSGGLFQALVKTFRDIIWGHLV